MHKGHNTTGSIVGTGAAINVSLGFIPEWVEVLNVTTIGGIEWHAGMGNGFGLKTISTGVRTVITTLGISAYAGVEGGAGQGFTIGADAVINVATNVIYWRALSKDA